MGARTSLIVVGYARVPRTSAVHGASEFLTVSLRIDRGTGVIIEVDSTAIAGMVRDWVSELLVGVNFADDIGPVLAEIDAHFLSNAAGSLKQAISDAWRRYAAYRSS
ncbi:DUF3870 domain-containing protein [Nonomuraea deserti]|nr:DUF3870 domain-containing protein [Nonomuraea deserti]